MAILNTARAAHLGTVPVKRIYKGTVLVWDNRRVYAAGYLMALLAGFACGKVQAPETVGMSATAHGGGTAEPRPWGFAGLLNAYGTMAGDGTGQAKTPAAAEMPATARLVAVCVGNTRGQVPASGRVDMRLVAAAEPRTPETVRSSGVAGLGDIFGSAEPRFVGKILGNGAGTLGDIHGGTMGTLQSTEQVTGQVTARLSGAAMPTLTKVCVVTFMHEWKTLYTVEVMAGESCADPVSAGLVEVPTKEPDSQYTYAYSGWTTVAGTAADATVLNKITGDTVLYAAFTKTPTQTDEVLALRTIEFASNADFKTDSGTDAYYASLTDTGELVSGNTYIVEWDGVEYTCVARDVLYSSSMSHPNTIGCTSHSRKHWVWGGFAKYSTTEAATGEPFNIWYTNGQMNICTTGTDASHTVKIQLAT